MINGKIVAVVPFDGYFFILTDKGNIFKVTINNTTGALVINLVGNLPP
jgi:hypothetical protein